MDTISTPFGNIHRVKILVDCFNQTVASRNLAYFLIIFIFLPGEFTPRHRSGLHPVDYIQYINFLEVRVVLLKVLAERKDLGRQFLAGNSIDEVIGPNIQDDVILSTWAVGAEDILCQEPTPSVEGRVSPRTQLLVRIPQGVLQSPHEGVAHHRDFQCSAPGVRVPRPFGMLGGIMASIATFPPVGRSPCRVRTPGGVMAGIAMFPALILQSHSFRWPLPIGLLGHSFGRVTKPRPNRLGLLRPTRVLAD